MTKPIWQKQLDEKFTLLEFPDEPNTLHCTIHYQDADEENDLTFAFGSWGMERGSITVEDCILCCQMLLACDANVSISSFASNLKYAQNELDDEDEEL
jgi:hypothetical protein